VADLVLHQYDNSPFSEKVRLVLGYKGMQWLAVTVPVIMPKPDLVALTGGYRRAPVLQIGADVYCDSALIVRQLERLRPKPTLYPDDQPLAEMFAAWADSTLFWTMIPVVMQPPGAARMLPDPSPEGLKAFAADRAAFTAGMRRLSALDASAQLATYLNRIERQLGAGRAFLFGAAPTIADFSLAHNVWFMSRVPKGAAVLAPFVQTLAWFERMSAFGHGRRSPITSEQALQISAGAGAARAPLEFDAKLGFEPRCPVAVSAIDYGTDPVVGALVGLTHDEVVLERHDARAGRVVVHFPRIGYQVRKHEEKPT